jgi:hypothetical protein
MAIGDLPASQLRKIPELIENEEHDDEAQAKRVLIINNNGVQSNTPMATKITVSDSITYVAKAAPGTAQASALWSCQKIDETTGVVITWADSGKYTQVATDLTSLVYL